MEIIIHIITTYSNTSSKFSKILIWEAKFTDPPIDYILSLFSGVLMQILVFAIVGLWDLCAL